MPMKIIGVETFQQTTLVFKCEPFVSELKMYSTPPGTNTLIFTDYSFTKLSIDMYDGVTTTNLKLGDKVWQLLDTDVDPWMDEVFTADVPLRPATVYTCSCPNHSHAILSAPQALQNEDTRKINRQRRYPLPTVQGAPDYQNLGRNKTAGKIELGNT